MIKGGWSKGEITDEIREICKHALVTIEVIKACKGCDPSACNFQPTSVRQQVVAGKNYQITGMCYGKIMTVEVYNCPWQGGVQGVKVSNVY
jgi:hypothetical protein